VRAAVIWDVLADAVRELAESRAGSGLEIVDVGGGTGGFAVPLARLGHHVTVVDPSPNALATLQRRASDVGIGSSITAVQGDAAGLIDAVGTSVADLVLCHDVLEVVDDPVEAAVALRAVLRPDGLASVLVAQRYAAVVARVITGHVAEARAILTSPQGSAGSLDPLPRRFDESALTELLESAGLVIRQIHGTRIFTDLVAGVELDDPGTAQELIALETDVATHPAFRAIASHLHVLAGFG
jgi:S-adenosylmethionine-dependent methyltransferase